MPAQLSERNSIFFLNIVVDCVIHVCGVFVAVLHQEVRKSFVLIGSTMSKPIVWYIAIFESIFTYYLCDPQ